MNPHSPIGPGHTDSSVNSWNTFDSFQSFFTPKPSSLFQGLPFAHVYPFFHSSALPLNVNPDGGLSLITLVFPVISYHERLLVYSKAFTRLPIFCSRSSLYPSPGGSTSAPLKQRSLCGEGRCLCCRNKVPAWGNAGPVTWAGGAVGTEKVLKRLRSTDAQSAATESLDPRIRTVRV